MLEDRVAAAITATIVAITVVVVAAMATIAAMRWWAIWLAAWAVLRAGFAVAPDRLAVAIITNKIALTVTLIAIRLSGGGGTYATKNHGGCDAWNDDRFHNVVVSVTAVPTGWLKIYSTQITHFLKNREV
jgi:hypothetical protein